MSAAPALRNIEIKKLCKLVSRFFRSGISPCPERDKEIIIFAESQYSVHHCGNAHCTVGFGIYAVFFVNVLYKGSIAGADAVMYILQRICPVSVLKPVLPLKGACRSRLEGVVGETCLYSCGTQLYSEIGPALQYFFRKQSF